MNRRALIEQYTDYWNAGDIAGFRSMIVDGCVRHDPGSTTTITLDENEQRFRAAHAQFPGLQLRNAWMWEHGDDAVTVAYSFTVGDTVQSSIEVFRFEGDRIAEVWNVAPGNGAWISA